MQGAGSTGYPPCKRGDQASASREAAGMLSVAGPFKVSIDRGLCPPTIVQKTSWKIFLVICKRNVTDSVVLLLGVPISQEGEEQ